MTGVFVTGTDTGIGKTVVSAALVHRCRAYGAVRYWKPIQTGSPEDDDTSIVAELGECREAELYCTGIRLPRPLSPHLSARIAGGRIELREVLAMAPTFDVCYPIVEGAGGVYVPLNDKELMIDLIAALKLRALIVARSGLGTINHTLLTLEALRSRAIDISGVVLVGDANPENRRAVEAYGRVTVLGEMPRFDSLTPAVLRSWATANLDPEGRLA
jgi:dethiobiotin synthase